MGKMKHPCAISSRTHEKSTLSPPPKKTVVHSVTLYQYQIKSHSQICIYVMTWFYAMNGTHILYEHLMVQSYLSPARHTLVSSLGLIRIDLLQN